MSISRNNDNKFHPSSISHSQFRLLSTFIKCCYIFYWKMSTKLNTQCPNCHHWFTNQKSFRHHIRACRRAINGNTASEIGTILANPLLSVGNTSISGQLSTSASDANDLQPLEELQDNYFDFVNNHSEGQEGETN
jgi:hypothetical protein